MTPDPPSATPPQPQRLLDQLREAARAAGHAEAAVTSFAAWACRYILFHGKRHPRAMGRAEIGRFLEHVVRTEKAPLPALDAARSVTWSLALTG